MASIIGFATLYLFYSGISLSFISSLRVTPFAACGDFVPRSLPLFAPGKRSSADDTNFGWQIFFFNDLCAFVVVVVAAAASFTKQLSRCEVSNRDAWSIRCTDCNQESVRRLDPCGDHHN